MSLARGWKLTRIALSCVCTCLFFCRSAPVCHRLPLLAAAAAAAAPPPPPLSLLQPPSASMSDTVSRFAKFVLLVRAINQQALPPILQSTVSVYVSRIAESRRQWRRHCREREAVAQRAREREAVAQRARGSREAVAQRYKLRRRSQLTICRLVRHPMAHP